MGVLAPAEAQAIVFAQHVGDADPTTEGWTAVPGSASTVGAINDGGTPAWFVDDAGSAAGSYYYYERTLTPSEVAAAANPTGWTLSTTIRVPSTQSPSFSFSPGVDYSTGTTRWVMGFEAINGNTQVQLITNVGSNFDTSIGPVFTVTGNSAYNIFELRFDPLTLTADLFVNGVEQISNYAGWNFVNVPGIYWGSLSSLDAGRGNFNAVSFMTTVPEAGSVLLMAAASGLAGGACWIRKRWKPAPNP
jgi:hypothetical protein